MRNDSTSELQDLLEDHSPKTLPHLSKPWPVLLWFVRSMSGVRQGTNDPSERSVPSLPPRDIVCKDMCKGAVPTTVEADTFTSPVADGNFRVIALLGFLSELVIAWTNEVHI